ncbi:MAG: MFS transporter [Anaerolineales bacterium]|nr:MFS transporter [Anaerolineales bacterium]
MKASKHYRWFVVAVFFAFMLLHQSDKLLIGPLTTRIMEDFNINSAQMGAVSSGALIVGAILYPIWGYLYDRYVRSKLLALASFIWGATTWLNALAPNYGSFLVTRASTGIDDSSYPGLYSLISDYFEPNMRGKVYGILQLTAPLGYMAGLVLATLFVDQLGWRRIFFITGTLGLILSVIIFFGVKEAPRGKSEPEMENLEEITTYKFDRQVALDLFKKRSLLVLFVQGFVGVFPWNVITYWFFAYLEKERFYSEEQILATMAPAILVLASGYFVGGWLGDMLFKRTNRGRVYVAMIGVITGAVLLYFTVMVPLESQGLFTVMLMATCLFIPLASPNVISTVYDITVPEVRSTALSIQYFIENAGAALAPWLAGLIILRSGYATAILSICIITWVLGAIFLAVTAWLIPHDIETLRNEMRLRAEKDRKLQAEV